MAWRTIKIEVRLPAALVVCAAVGVLVFFCAARLASESVTLSTYYPAPSGVYAELVATGNSWLARDRGRLGVGVYTPQTKLDVGGAVRLGSEPCTLAARGAIQWNNTAGRVEVCDGGLWMPISSLSLNTYTKPGSTVACPAGEVMTGGGCWCQDATGGNDSSAYGGRPNGNGWECMNTTGAGCSGGLTSYVRCAR